MKPIFLPPSYLNGAIKGHTKLLDMKFQMFFVFPTHAITLKYFSSQLNYFLCGKRKLWVKQSPNDTHHMIKTSQVLCKAFAPRRVMCSMTYVSSSSSLYRHRSYGVTSCRVYGAGRNLKFCSYSISSPGIVLAATW